MQTAGYLGIDVGTQGLSIIFTNQSMDVLESGDGHYDMLPDADEGAYQQSPGDWEAAMVTAMQDLREKLGRQGIDPHVLAIGIAGQMHGEVWGTADVDPLANSPKTFPARLWCDARNEAEAQELTDLLQTKMPKRMTSVRWLWSLRHRTGEIADITRLTTPAGWIAYRLTGQWILGIGDASGMFPIDPQWMDYDRSLLQKYQQHLQSSKQLRATQPRSLTDHNSVHSLQHMLPTVRCAGQDGGTLNQQGADLLNLPLGIPVAPAEGDQPAAMAGSLIAAAGTVSMSFGTSVCANSVGDRKFQGVSRAIDHFCAVDGKPINMVWLRNGTTYMNTIIAMFGDPIGAGNESNFAAIIPQIMAATPDCGGILALPFMDDEPGLGVQQGGTAMIVGLNPDNAAAGNIAKAALLATMFNLKIGSTEMREQGFPFHEIVLSGGLTKSPALGQILADVFNLPVTILDSASEGSAWGAALLAKYRHETLQGTGNDWAQFLSQHQSGSPTKFIPQSPAVSQYESVYARYKELIAVHTAIDSAVNPSSHVAAG